MQLCFYVALPYLARLAAAERQRRIEGLVNMRDIAWQSNHRRVAGDDEAFSGAVTPLLNPQTMIEAAGEPTAGAQRSIGSTTGFAIQVPLSTSSLAKEGVSAASAGPAWYRSLAKADYYPPSTTLGPVQDDVSPDRALQRTDLRDNPPRDFNSSASIQQAGEEERDGCESSKEAACTREARSTAADKDGNSSSGLSPSTAAEGIQTAYELHREPYILGELSGASSTSSWVEQDVELQRKVPDLADTVNRAPKDVDVQQSSSTSGIQQTANETAGRSEDRLAADGGDRTNNGLRVLGRKRRHPTAQPVKLPPLGTVTLPHQMPKSPQGCISPSPPKVAQPKQPMPPPKKVSTVKKSFGPPKKTYSVRKVHTPLKVVRTKKVAPPFKTYLAPKKVAYPKKLSKKELSTTYIFSRKIYIPLAKRLPAPKKLTPLPVYVPLANKL